MNHTMTLRELWERIHELVKEEKLDCRQTGGCDSSCCRFSPIGFQPPGVTPNETEEIKNFISVSNIELPPLKIEFHSEEKCRFLNDVGRCIIYSVRPTRCRVFFCIDDERKEIVAADDRIKARFMNLLSQYSKDNPEEETNSGSIQCFKGEF